MAAQARVGNKLRNSAERKNSAEFDNFVSLKKIKKYGFTIKKNRICARIP